jgi:hypothetical protein
VEEEEVEEEEVEEEEEETTFTVSEPCPFWCRSTVLLYESTGTSQPTMDDVSY